jgi:hypothetical protein
MTLSAEDLNLKLAQYNLEIDGDSFEKFWVIDGKEVYGITVPGDEAVAMWERLRELVSDTGYYPVIVGDRWEVMTRHLDEIDQRSSRIIVEKILAEAEDINASQWFIDEDREMREDDENDWVGEDFPDDRTEIDREVLAEIDYWHETFEEDPEYTIPSLDETLMLLIPTVNSWEIFAFLQFGGWNSCPADEEHVAIAKRWNNLYGAEVVGMSNDVVEMRVIQPPLTADSAFRLAQEQYIYCQDNVDQGAGSLTKLAVNLYANKIWYFWWD